MVIDDGRRFLERSADQFDVIAIDPPPPISAPTSSLLYSEEFYGFIKRHLRPGGILQVWCPGGDPATMAAITRALFRSFPYVIGYESMENWGVHYLVSMQPIADLEPEDLARKMPLAAARDMVEWNPGKTPEQIFHYVLGRKERIEDYIKRDPAIPP
jgi:predicted membrane-bound spermidine synthase